MPVREIACANSERFQSMTAQREFAKQIPYAAYMPGVQFVNEYLAEYEPAIEAPCMDLRRRKRRSTQRASGSRRSCSDSTMTRSRRKRAPSMTARCTNGRFAGYLFVAPYLILFFTFLLLPLFYGLGLSFTKYEMASTAPARFVGLANYREAFDDATFKPRWA